jgi:hypothetical protein
MVMACMEHLEGKVHLGVLGVDGRRILTCMFRV